MMLVPEAIMGLGPQELIIILVIVLLLFGGSRLAGLGKSSGRALKEFKEETKGLREDKDATGTTPPPAAPQVTTGQGEVIPPTYQQAPPNYQETPPTYQQPPASYQQNPPSYQQTPPQVSDPSASDVRRDV